MERYEIINKLKYFLYTFFKKLFFYFSPHYFWMVYLYWVSYANYEMTFFCANYYHATKSNRDCYHSCANFLEPIAEKASYLFALIAVFYTFYYFYKKELKIAKAYAHHIFWGIILTFLIPEIIHTMWWAKL